MVLPSSVFRRGAMGISVIGGGVPLGFRASIFSLDDAVAPVLRVAASSLVPASSAGVAPNNDNSLRRFMICLPPAGVGQRIHGRLGFPPSGRMALPASHPRHFQNK